MKFSLFLVALFCFALAINAEFKHKKSKKWLNHSKKYNLAFKNDQTEANAFEEFLKVDKTIQEHNSKNDVSYTLGHNEYSHLGMDFFKNLKGSREFIQSTSNKRGFETSTITTPYNVSFSYYTHTPGYIPPASIDWVANGWNTTVRNQIPCGSCWAFATTASVEFAIWKNQSRTVTLSPQELVDCSRRFGNNGCSGGVVLFALDYIKQNGISYESNYTYRANDGSCQLSTQKDGIPPNLVKGYARVKPGNELALMEVLNLYGPVAVSIFTNTPQFNSYKNGLYTNCTNGYLVDHAVLLVGYGIYDASNTQNPNLFGKKYWRIKNQWGPTWGNGGYMDITREIPNSCGITYYGQVPML